MRLLLFSATLALGLLIVFYAGNFSMMPVHVQSDMLAFASKVEADDTASHVLRYGGEKEGTDFRYLLDRVASLSDGWFSVMWLGVGVSVVSGLGVGLEVASRRRLWKDRAKGVT
jgi:hypothetical protein